MEQNYELLANAVIERAANDYTEILCKVHRYTQKLKDIERFFTGDDIKLYTTMDGQALLDKLNIEAKAYNYDWKAIKKSRQKDED